MATSIAEMARSFATLFCTVVPYASMERLSAKMPYSAPANINNRAAAKARGIFWLSFIDEFRVTCREGLRGRIAGYRPPTSVLKGTSTGFPLQSVVY